MLDKQQQALEAKEAELTAETAAHAPARAEGDDADARAATAEQCASAARADE